MMKVTKKRNKKQKRGKRIITLLCLLVILFFCMVILLSLRNGAITSRLSYQLCYLILNQISPNLSADSSVSIHEDSENDYETRQESALIYERILAQNVTEVNTEAGSDAEAGEVIQTQDVKETSASVENTVNLEKLNDFDYLIQKFYTVDSMTTINGSLLNTRELLEKNCQIAPREDDAPQILIYHTHGSEGYCDSAPGDSSTTVVGVGEHLTQLLNNTYGYHVLHDTGIYDRDRDRAYSVAAPSIEQILSENPSIEVVIDLHRDGVPDSTHLVTEQNGVPMAQIMFFNGLSRTTAMGDISYLPNPYIKDNLAFSLQMKLKANELYPDLARKIYLKGYRYNLHFRPKSLLIEVGAQNNTLEEAMNAMVPLAEILDQVLKGK